MLINCLLIHFTLETPKGALPKCADQDQTRQNAASDAGLN